MVFNTTFNNISVISWLSVLLVEETGIPGINHRPAASQWQTWSHIVVLSTSRHEQDPNSQLLWWYALIASKVDVSQTTIQSWPLQPLHLIGQSKMNESLHDTTTNEILLDVLTWHPSFTLQTNEQSTWWQNLISIYVRYTFKPGEKNHKIELFTRLLTF
jgi:hypothetical protein